MVTYVNDLRLSELATGEGSGTWGTTTNTNLELIGEALGYATEAITTNADTHATTVADGSTDPGRAMFIKYTGTLDSACTITIGPNTLSRVHIIENATSGSQNIIIKQGSGSEITIPNGYVKAVYLDGAGSGAAVTEAFADLSIGPNLRIGNAAAEDTAIVFDGNAQDFYIGLDDSADDLIIGLGSTVGTTPIISVDENKDVAIPDGGLTITTDDNTNQLTLISTDADANAGPGLDLYRNSSSPADNDVLGTIFFHGEDGAGNKTEYARIESGTDDVSNGAEAGSLTVFTNNADTLTNNRFEINGTGLVINESSGDFDTRIESNGNTHMLFVDAGNDHVNFGTATDYGGVVNIESTDNNATLVLACTDPDASTGPQFDLTRNSGSPSDGDTLGRIRFNGMDDGGNELSYGHMTYSIVDASDGSEDGKFEIDVRLAGTNRSRMLMSATETVFNNEQVDLDFRVEGDGNANAFVVEAENDTVILGHGVKRENFFNSTYGAQLQIENFATVGNYIGMATTTNSNDANGGYIVMGTTRGTVGNSTTIAQNGDFFGSLSFQGADGNQLVEGASIAAQVDGVPGANDMPGSLQFRTTADGQSTVTEHMRISNTGMVSMGTTAQNGGGWTERLQVAGNSTRSNVAFFTGFSGSAVTGFKSGNSTSAVNFLIFYNYNDTAVGSIQISNAATGTSISFNTTSDYRLKENVEYDWDGLTRLKQLKPARFTWKADDSGTVVDGFIAHEAQQVVPESVTGTYNETEDVTDVVLNSIGNVIDEGITEDDWKAGKDPVLWTEDDLNIPDGVSVGDVKTEAKYAADTTWKAKHTKDKYQGIDHSKLVPLLVKAVQEQQTLLETLETKVQALESG